MIYSGCAFPVFLYLKAAVLERKGVEVGLDDGGKDLFLLAGVLVAAVHEAVLLAGVPVEVTVQHEVTLLFHALYHLLRVVDGRVQLLVGVDPLPVQVHQTQVAPVVAHNHSVGVQHGHYLKDEVLPQHFG